MHVNNRSKILSLALKTLTGAVASAVFLSSAAYAAGLGKLTVLSSLGQPLRAEIELTAVSSEEASGLVAKLAAPDAYRLANIEFNPALLSLRFTVEQRSGRQYIKITSTQPVNEPFVDMLLELSWSSGRLVREYTFLLDPAELRTTQPAQVAAPVDVLSQGSRPVPPASQQFRPAPKPATAAQQPAPAPAAAQPVQPSPPKSEQAGRSGGAVDEYKVKRGDTLGGIATRLKPVDISLDMMLVALYRANPDAFSGNNMNRLKSGQILSVPDAETIRGTGQGEARGVVIAHAADFNAYRNKLAGQVAESAPSKAPEARQSAAGKITAKVEERPTAANESQDQLKLSKATAGDAGGKTAAVSAEDKIAKEKALADATARVKELERNVSDLEKLMEVKSKAGADAVKAPVAAAKPAAPAAKPAAPVAKAPPPPIKTSPALKNTPPPAEPSLVDMLMDNINYVGAGLAVLLLGLFGLSKARARKAGDRSPSEPSILGAPTDQAHSLFAETGGQSVDTNNSVFNSSFAPSASQLDTNEVDPVAEADVYIAYGRDAQAEEILKEALRTHPERYPVRLKLLEIYAARKDQRAFESQASEMYSLTKGQGDDWAQAAALGLAIDPLNPLYAGAATASPVGAAPSSEEAAQQALLSQQLNEALSADAQDNALDMDLSDDATALPAAPAAKAEEHTLDFDLGGLSFEPISQTAPIAMPGPTADSVPDMAFTSEPFGETPALKSTAPAALSPEEASFDMAFDMAFDSPATPSAPAPAPEHQKALGDISLDLASNDLTPEFNMDDLSKPPATPAAPAQDPMMELDAMSFDLPSSAGAAPAGEPPALMPTPNAPQFDMSSIDLDLPTSAAGDTALPDALPDFQIPGIEEALDAGELSAAHMEMETKLDLAIAYQEIGDKEGARELLDEVIKGGSADQVGKANEMRSKLA